MPITTNENGTLYVLDTITANEGGVLYNLDTVHSNEGGTLYEIHSAWKAPDSISWYEDCVFGFSLSTWTLNTPSGAYIPEGSRGRFLVESRTDKIRYNYGEFTVTKKTVMKYTLTRSSSNYDSNSINSVLYSSLWMHNDFVTLANNNQNASVTGTITLEPGKYLIEVYSSGGGQSGSGANVYQVSLSFSKA